MSKPRCALMLFRHHELTREVHSISRVTDEVQA